ncbi:MAG: 1-acyl-sn-glycerol-3-phosphate acyltransferase [Lachnospiraceae bacterium]|nr:1-acyl-sn-glycerol-3-phosphate acyltransferase [Lachnospiraceae bacterium]
MLRFYWVILRNLYHLYMIPQMEYMARRKGKYTPEMNYRMCQKVIYYMARSGKIHTDCFGSENLPKEGGYVMYANHQGKYDALGIIRNHEQPCSVVIDDKRSHVVLTTQFIKLLEGIRLKKDDMRQSVALFNEMVEKISQGIKYIIFPEGGYDHNGNQMREFKSGAFKCAVKAKAPIVPVALIDSYKVFEGNSLAPVNTQVHYLEPLYFEEYQGLKTREISEIVKQRIADKINEIISETAPNQ